MPRARTVPCLPCKDKHLKCDGGRPVCQRCRDKGLECRRHSLTTVFVSSNEDEFSKDQEWVTSRADRFCFDFCEPAVQTDGNESIIQQTPPRPVAPPAAVSEKDERDSISEGSIGRLGNELLSSLILDQSHPSLAAVANIGTGRYKQFPLQNFQEACLLKHFIDHVAPWFDIADPDRHFHLVVPIIARSQPHLLNAMFALSARHMSCDPNARTPEGIKFHDRLLPGLSPISAIEYMQECIPALRYFHEGLDDEYLGSVITTAVLLRQLELIDKENANTANGLAGSPNVHSVLSESQDAFLPLINGIFQSPVFTPLFNRSGLVRAACLMVLRQEIYYSMTSRLPTQIVPADCIAHTSFIHEVSVHMIQVIQWCWGDGSRIDWNRLIRQQEYIEQNSLMGIQPLYQEPADVTKGEVVPMIWYSSRTEVYCTQIAMMARSILTLQGSALSGEPSALPRIEAEKECRTLISELYGIAAGFTGSPHAILHASLMTRLYGRLFTDDRHRMAFSELAHAGLNHSNIWPFRNLAAFEIITI